MDEVRAVMIAFVAMSTVCGDQSYDVCVSIAASDVRRGVALDLVVRLL